MAMSICDEGHEYEVGDGCPVCRPIRRRNNKRKWRKNNPYKNHRSKLKHQYGITPEIVVAMLVEQDYACYWCKKYITVYTDDYADKAAIDHDGEHKVRCGWEDVRSLLCHGCNTTLGKAHTKGMLNSHAIEYLESRPHKDLIERMINEDKQDD